MSFIQDLSQEILRRTNGGLAIIQGLYPQANERHHFKLRDERTASCSLHKQKDGNYTVKDFGAGTPAKNAIQLYAEENGLDFTQATLLLAKAYHINTGQSQEKNEAKFRKIDQSEWQNDQGFDETGFCYETKDFTDTELKVLGPFVMAKVCEKYALYSLKWYAIKKEGKITIVEPTENFPIFIFVFGDKDKKFYKILQPKSEDKKWRFFWKGTKPNDFIGGLSVLQKEYAKRKANEEASYSDESEEVEEAQKIDMAFLCSGERDALNMASLGYFVLWQNSETAELKSKQYKRIMDNVQTLYNIPDLDETGRREGHNLAMQYLEIRTLWLPDWLQKKKDWRGNRRKDLCDFFELNSYYDKKVIDRKIKDLIYTAYPMQFWDEEIGKDKKKRYTVNNVHTFNFLHRNGFCRLDAPNEKDSYKYIHIDEHIVREIKSIHIKEYINDFAEKRRLSVPIRNMLYNTTRLSDAQIAALPRKELDFTNSYKDTQFLFFSNAVWRITPTRIDAFEHNLVQKYVWNEDTIDALIESKINREINTKAIKIEAPYFKIKKQHFYYDIEILEQDCEFLNFMVQISRMHWKAEIEGLNEEQTQEYWQNNKFSIASERLDEEQRTEHKAHLVNKIYALGYLLHHYKVASRPWLVYAMENGLVDDDESKGGSGKSVYLKAPSFLMNSKVIGSRNAKIWDNQHLFEGVTEQTKYILFDDADKYFKLENLYTNLTGGIDVNPKNNKQYMIPFYKAPKFAITSNYSLRKTDDSTLRRLLFVSTSDYYHAAGEYYEEERSPRDDFKHELFRDWTDIQWNKYINLCAQAIQFYLSVEEKINPPMDGVLLRNLQAQMGPSFIEWADYFLTNNLNKPFNKRLALEDLQTSKQSLKHISSTNFVKRVKAWCQFKEYTYMPDSAVDKSGRIQKKTEEGKVEDFLLIADNNYDETKAEENETKLPF